MKYIKNFSDFLGVLHFLYVCNSVKHKYMRKEVKNMLTKDVIENKEMKVEVQERLKYDNDIFLSSLLAQRMKMLRLSVTPLLNE